MRWYTDSSELLTEIDTAGGYLHVEWVTCGQRFVPAGSAATSARTSNGGSRRRASGGCPRCYRTTSGIMSSCMPATPTRVAQSLSLALCAGTRRRSRS